jgi:hypothetical protein
LLVGFVASAILGACNVFEARSGDLECTSTPECTRDRVCENGYCVVPGAASDADPNAPDADPNAPDSTVVNDGGTIDCWNPDWSRRRRLVFDNSGQAGALTAFPVLVKLDSDNFDYTRTQNAGQDLRFVDRDGALLAHEIERWNEQGASFVWVKVPEIDGSSSSDFVYMLYGNDQAPDAQAKAAVWSEGYQGVWHLKESTGAHVDSAQSISCTWSGGGFGSQNAAGQIGRANSFDNNNIDCGIDKVTDTAGSTITAWLNPQLAGDSNQTVVSLDSLSGDESGIGLHMSRMGELGTMHNQGYIYGNSTIAQNAWTYAAIRATRAASGGSIEVSANGGAWESIASGDTSNLQIVAGTPLTFAESSGSGQAAGYYGRIDEIRISGVARSDDWIRAQYLSMNNNFIQFVSDPQECL